MEGELVEHSNLLQQFEHFEHLNYLVHSEPPLFAIFGAPKPPFGDALPIVPCGHLARRDQLEPPKKPCAKKKRLSRQNESEFYFLSKCKGETSARCE